MRWRTFATTLLASGELVQAINIDLSSSASVKSAAKIAADGAMKFYAGSRTGEIPGLLPQPYFWWEAGELWGHMVEYFYATGDSTYNDIVSQALLFQVGPNNDYLPPNQTKSEGNDDQASWGLAALSAAELGFPSPPQGQPSWLSLAQAVFEDIAKRWDDKTCNGGLRWQIFTFNSGYNYKNSLSNGDFFLLSSRLARYTGNDTYATWANKVFDWIFKDVRLMSSDYQIYDGTDSTLNCTQIDHVQWTNNAGIFLQGAATMYNYTNGSQVWSDRMSGLLNAANVFYKSNVLTEVACESNMKCNIDQRVFKSIFARALGRTVQFAPFTLSSIEAKLIASSQAAANSCSGLGNNTCGFSWTKGFDGSTGVGEQLNALAVFQANLFSQAPALSRGAGAGGSASGSGTATGSNGTNGTTASGTAASSASPTHNGVEKAFPDVCKFVLVFITASMLLFM